MSKENPMPDVKSAEELMDKIESVWFGDEEKPMLAIKELITAYTADKDREIERLRELVKDGGVGLIATERERQVSAEGWTPEHDDEHDECELWRAARSYLVKAYSEPDDDVPIGWPWRDEYWKPSKDPIRNLVKAGALIAAEIDRLQRKAALQESGKEGV